MDGGGWRVRIPEGLIAKPHKAWGYDSGSIARGWIGEAPVTVIVQVKRLETGFNEWVRQVHGYWLEQEEPRRIAVPGANDAVRVDGIVEFDGLGAAGDREHCVSVCAKRGREAFALTIRSRPEDGIQAQLEPIVGSFEIVQP
jgi:hypothetical protein